MAPASARGSRWPELQANDHRALLSLSDSEARLAAQLELRVGPDGPLHQRMTLRNTADTRYSTQSDPHVPGAVGRNGTSRHHGSPPARADSAAARSSPTAPICARAAAEGRAPTRRFFSRPADQDSASRRAESTASTSHGAATTASSLSGFRRARPSLAAASCSAPGEVILRRRVTQTPWVIGELGRWARPRRAHRFHALGGTASPPRRSRPVTLNTLGSRLLRPRPARAAALADARPRGVGVERFVLDDGWFAGRRRRPAGLGDWFVDEPSGRTASALWWIT